MKNNDIAVDNNVGRASTQNQSDGLNKTQKHVRKQSKSNLKISSGIPNGHIIDHRTIKKGKTPVAMEQQNYFYPLQNSKVPTQNTKIVGLGGGFHGFGRLHSGKKKWKLENKNQIEEFLK